MPSSRVIARRATVAGHEDRPRRRRANGEASRQKILIAATEIAAERGYEGTSIGLVSERSGLPASSIYWHFKDKDALIAAVIERSFAQWLIGAGGWGLRRPDEPVRERVTAMMKRTAKALQDSSDFLRLGLMLALERRQVEPSARKMFLAVRTEALRRTAGSYGELFPDLTSAEVDRLATFTMAITDGLFIASEIDGDTTDLLGDVDLLATALMAVADELVARKRTSSRSRH
jgi:AcrR family transcriptional regulator